MIGPEFPVQHHSRQPFENEEALVRQAKVEARAFGALYDRYVDAVYGYCYRRLQNHHDAEDATAATFGNALQGLQTYVWTGAPFGAWLFRIAASRVADLRRAKARTLPLDCWTETPPEEDISLDGMIEREEHNELWRLVESLPLGYRRVLVLRFGQDLTNEQVARILNRSQTATKQLVYRALQMLRSRHAANEEAQSHG